MGVEAIGFEWLNHDILRNQTPETADVTRHAFSIEEICDYIVDINMGLSLPPLPERKKALDKYATTLLGGTSGDAGLKVGIPSLKASLETGDASLPFPLFDLLLG